MSEPVRICMVGAGRVAQVHTHSLAQFLPNGRVAAVVDPVQEARKSLMEAYAVPAGFDSLEEAFAGVRFDAVAITTPTHTHAELAVQAAQQGAHIFLEKPMALTLAECDAISEACRSHGVLLQLGFMRRFDPEFAAAYQRIQAGEIGQPLLIKSLTHGPGLPPPWAREMATSNGMLAEVNSHDWDTLRWMMGADYSRVYAEVANLKGPGRGVEAADFYDHALVSVRFENGALGSISGICPCDYGYDARVEVHGKNGILVIGALAGQALTVCTDRDQGLRTPIYRTWPERFTWGYIHEMAHFLDCIASGEQPAVGGEDGRWAVAGVLAATRSFQEGRPVALDEILSPGGAP